MKTKPSAFLLFAAIGIALGNGSLINAQTVPGESAVIDGFVIRDGRTYQVRNGQATPVGQDQVLRITPQGEIIGFDGQRRELSERTMLTLDGRVIPAPPGTVYATPQALPSGPNNQLSDNRADQPDVTGENVSGLAPGSPDAARSSAVDCTEGTGSANSNQPMNRVEGTSAPLTTGDNRGGPNYNNNDGFVNPALVPQQVIPTDQNGNNAATNNATNTNATQAGGATGANATTPNQQSNGAQGRTMTNQSSSSGQTQPQQRATNNPNAQPTTGPGSNNDTGAGTTDNNPNNSATPNAPDPTERPNSSNARSGNSGSSNNGGSNTSSGAGTGSGSSSGSSSGGSSSGASGGSSGGATGGVR